MPGRQPHYAVDGFTGEFVYVGPAFYEDEDGPVEHDHLRMVPVGGGDEVWVAPQEVHLIARESIAASA